MHLSSEPAVGPPLCVLCPRFSCPLSKCTSLFVVCGVPGRHPANASCGSVVVCPFAHGCVQ